MLVRRLGDQMMRLARDYTRCRYGQMHYLAGTPDTAIAPTLILLHQNPSSSQEYYGLVREMARDRRVIAFDTPGYGMSDPPPGALGMMEYAAAFSDAIDALALAGPLDVYGFHTGALLAAELGLARPDCVARIAVTGIPMYDPERRATLLQEAIDTPPPTDDGAAMLARMAALWDYAVTQRAPGVPLDRAVLTFADKNRTLDRAAWAYRGVWSYNYERLQRIGQPVLLIQPHEKLRDVSLAAAALIRDVRVVDLPDLDRDVLELGNHRIADAMRGFFTPLPETTP